MNTGTIPTSADIRAQAARCIFGNALIENIYRGLVSEIIVGTALGPAWKWLGNWSGWDFINQDGTRLEVKQSALRQTWSDDYGHLTKPSFDIEVRPGQYERDGTYVANPNRIRFADVYVFAHHFDSADTADHADPAQWEFYVVPGNRLPPNQKTIAVSKIRKLTQPVRWDALGAAVSGACSGA